MMAEVFEKTWWPVDYADEYMPTGFPTPEDWIRPLGQGFFTLKSPYHDDPEDEEARWQFHPLKDGEKIEFMFKMTLPSVEVTIRRDGTFEVHGTIDPRANHFSAYGNPDTGCGDTIAEFVKNFVAEDYLDDDKSEERLTILTCQWSGEGDSATYSVKLEPGKCTLELAGRA